MSTQDQFHGIKAVFFDLFNTLARFWPPREAIQAQACGEFGITVTADGVAHGYAVADAYMNEVNASPNPLRLQTAPQRDVFFARYEQMILHGAGADVDLARASDIWNCVRAIPYGMALFDDVLPSLQRLRERGFLLGIISNMNTDGASLARQLGLDGVVHHVVTSFEAQVEKPHPAIFKEALRRANIAPHEAVMVGDQVTSDIRGARGAGIHPVLIDRYDITQEQVGCPHVSTMAELEALLPHGKPSHS